MATDLRYRFCRGHLGDQVLRGVHRGRCGASIAFCDVSTPDLKAGVGGHGFGAGDSTVTSTPDAGETRTHVSCTCSRAPAPGGRPCATRLCTNCPASFVLNLSSHSEDHHAAGLIDCIYVEARHRQAVADRGDDGLDRG